MNNRIFDGVLINLLQKGPTTGTIQETARQLIEEDSISARYKQTVRSFSIEDFPAEDTLFPGGDEHHRLFHWHYRPRVYKVFGFFDLAILQLCDSVEIISELSTQRNISATQNIFGLRTRTGPREEDLCGTLEICSPLLPYLFICNVKVHPFVQMLLGKDLQALLNLHFADYLDEIEVLGRAAETAASNELITLAVIDTFGWNELTLLIHGSSFDRMIEFVWNRIRALRLGDLPTQALGLLPDLDMALHVRIAGLADPLRLYGFQPEDLTRSLPGLPVFSHTESIPCVDYGIGERLCGVPQLAREHRDAFFAVLRRELRSRIEKNSSPGRYLQRTDPSGLMPALDQILADMLKDRAGCLTGFSILPGKDEEFHRLLSRELGVASRGDANAEVVLGQYDAFLRQYPEPGSDEGLLGRLQKILQMRSPQKVASLAPELTGGEPGADLPRPLFPLFKDLVISSKTSVSSPIQLEPRPSVQDPFETLRQQLPRIFKFKESTPGPAERILIDCCRRIQMPKPLQIALEHTIEPFYSFLQNPSLFLQYIDLFLPLLLITRQIERAAAGKPDDHRPVAEHVSRELRQFNHAFQARFQASHLNSESTEPTLEFKAHTVTPLDTIQCIIDCFTQSFVGFDTIAGFPLISVSSRPQIHVSRVFSVELNSFHLLYPESLLVLFHELGHLYLRYRGQPKCERLRQGPGNCLIRMLKVDDEHTTKRWTAFSAGLAPAESGQPVDPRDVAVQAEEILSDLFLLTGVCRQDWTVFLWYVLAQIEALTEYFPPDALPGDPQQTALYCELVMRLFFVDIFRRTASSDRPEVWAAGIRLERVRELAGELRRQSKKIRDFCAKNDHEALDFKVWRLVESLARPAESLAPSADGIVGFQDNGDFWSPEVIDVRSHPGLPSLFVSLLFVSYRCMLEEIVSNGLLACGAAEVASITAAVDIDLDRLRKGESLVVELDTLLHELIVRDRTDPVEYLDRLRDAPSSSWKETFLPSGKALWPVAYRRVTKALYALVRFFHAENTAASEDLRYLYRAARTGDPERFQDGRSDVPESPCFGGEHAPLPIVIDRRGVFFCRSTAARQRAFQYRNAVIRELADLHSKLRPAKMAEIHAITENYRGQLRSERDH
jgi:hypothetical protein